MSWLIPRSVLTALCVAACAVLGQWVGGLYKVDAIGTAVGAALGAGFVVLLDTVRAHRLIRWLSASIEKSAPRTSGLWGELGYRIERIVRERDREIERESKLLAQFLEGIEASPNGVLLLDSQDQIEWCNRVGAEHFGLDAQRDRQQRITNLVRYPVFVANLQTGRTDEPFLLSNWRGQKTLSVLIRSYGEGMKLVLSQDITEREGAEAMRRDFVANVSHEIRTPLTVLAGFVETMTSLRLSEVETKRVLTLMGQQTARMQSLVGDLLTLAQLEGSPRPDIEHWVDMQALLARAVADGSALSAGRHTLHLDDTADMDLAASQAEVLSAITNLVSNAVRYTPDGGLITLAWRNSAAGGAELSVADSGIGVAAEHLPRLTERFYRVDSSRSRDTGGTGLGLSIVKHVVQRHGGYLDVSSEVGHGSIFRLVFPSMRVRERALNPS